MNRLKEFFKDEGESGPGVFYPLNHIVAVFPTSPDADRAKKEVDAAAPAAIAVTGDELIDFAGDQAAKAGIWGSAMREVSRMIGTEEQYVDYDIDQAKKGAGFVAAYCPDEETKAGIWAVLKNANPLAARYYGAGGIEHLVGGGR